MTNAAAYPKEVEVADIFLPILNTSVAARFFQLALEAAYELLTTAPLVNIAITLPVTADVYIEEPHTSSKLDTVAELILEPLVADISAIATALVFTSTWAEPFA